MLGLINPFAWIRKIISLVLLIVLLTPAYVALQVYNTGHNATPTKSDAIVIMGAAQNNGTPTPILQARIEEAKRLYKEGYAPRILTVGANQKGDLWTEAQASVRALAKGQIPKSVLNAVNLGKDTLSSTIAYVDVMKAKGYKSVIIVTDAYHCYRAIAMATDLGVKATCSPAKTGPASVEKTNWRYIARETGAYLAYKTADRFGIHLSDQNKK
ncbi:MAG: YdcF family protein [Actinomycetes bacterium]